MKHLLIILSFLSFFSCSAQDVITASGAKSIYYLSKSGCVSDAKVTLSSATFGTDNATAIQAVLNNASASNPIIIYWDIRSSTGTTLKIKSNTTIIAAPGCGNILRNGVNKPMFRNADTAFSSAIVDSNIIIKGGIWNGNNAGQTTKGDATDGLCNVFSFFGVDNLILRDFTIYTPKVYAVQGIHITNGIYENGKVDVGPSGAINMDGLHFDGWSKHCIGRNLWLNCHDDNFGINADDLYGSSSYAGGVTGSFYPTSASGPVEDITWENIYLANSFMGGRILSGTSRVDNIKLRNITGSTQGYALVIDNYWQSPSSVSKPGSGNIGTVQIENLNVAVTATASGINSAVVNVNCNVEKLLIKDLKRNDISIAVPTLWVTGSGTTINSLVLDGYDSYDATTSNAIAHLKIDSAIVHNLVTNRVAIDRAGATNGSPFLQLRGGARVDFWQFNNIYTNHIDNILDNTTNGTIQLIAGQGLTHLNHTTGSASFLSANAISRINLSNYVGDSIILASSVTTKTGDAFSSPMGGGTLTYTGTGGINTNAFFTAANITNPTQQTAVNNFSSGLQAKTSLYGKCIAIYPIVGGVATSHKYNLLNTAQYALTFNGTWTHSANGMQPDGTTGYAATGFIPANVYSSLTDVGFTVCVNLTSYKASSTEYGAYQSLTQENGLYLRSGAVLSVNSDEGASIINVAGTYTDATGVWTSSRTSSNSHVLYRNGSVFASNTATQPASSLPTVQTYIGAGNTAGGAAAGFSNHRYSMIVIHKGLTAQEAADLNTLIANYETALSR